jgi:hypothetical protein
MSAERNFIVVVSGLPRSGTSMMMRMLEAGGLPIVTDHVRAADHDNPRGYYEFEPAKKTRQDASWLESSEGKAVKMVYKLVYDLSGRYSYRVIVMRRKLEEILASQRKMLERLGKEADTVSDEKIGELLTRELTAFDAWLRRQPNFVALDVDYNQVLADPLPLIERVNAFLGGGLDREAMQRVVEPELYRNRA